MTRTPFDDIRALTQQLPQLDAKSGRAMTTIVTSLPDKGAHLGGAAAALERWAEVRGTVRPIAQRPTLTLFAATHDGHTASAKRQADILAALAAGGMPVNFACGEAGVGLRAFELALDHPTPDPVVEDTLSERDCAATIAFGMEALADGPDVVLLSHTPSPGAPWAGMAICAALHLDSANPWPTLDRRLAAALKRIGGERDPLFLLRAFGGRDCAAMTGAILAARAQKALVILDGWGAAAAYRVCHRMDADSVAHCVFADGAATLQLANAQTTQDIPLRDCPSLRCTATDDAYGMAAVAALVQLKTAAAIAAKAPSAKQLGLDA